MPAYATAADVAEWLDAPAPAGVDRLIARASELIDSVCLNRGQALADPLAPVYPYIDSATVDMALRNAVCAQIEQWLTVGEDNSIAGYTGRMSLGSMSVDAPAKIAPRALQILRQARLTQPIGW